MSKPVLTLMCGLPRCGKSTWIRKNKGDAVIVCPDDVRSSILGHQFHKNAEDFVWAISKAMVRLLLEQKKDIIIDATNLTSTSRGDWIKIANDYKAHIRIVWIKTSIKKCKERNLKSKKGQKLPSEVIDRMALIFENPWYYKEKAKPEIELIEIPKSRKSKSTKERAFFENYYRKEAIKDMLKPIKIVKGK